MKYYIVTLKEVIDVINFANDRELIKKNLKFWFKSSKSVKKVVTGKVVYVNDRIWIKTNLYRNVPLFKRFLDKNITIWVEENN